MGISIKDAPLVEQLTGGEKMPLSDGSGLPKSATAKQIKEYANEGMATEQWTEGKLKGKVDNVDGKQLSTEDFTTLLKQKLEGLSNYDDAAIQEAVSKLRTDLDTLVSGDTTSAIETFNEVIAFLDGLEDTGDLASIIASIERQIGEKQDKLISGTNIKTVNGQSLLGSGNIVVEGGGGGGAVDLTGYATESWVNGKLTAKVDKVDGKGLSTNDFTTTEKEKLSGIASGAEVNVQSDWNVTDTSSDAYIKNKPTIPSAVTEDTVSGWGFTKNTGTYSKPSTGIPKSDLASNVQTSLGKADTALQSHQDISHLATKDEVAKKQDKVLKFTNISASAWVSDTTYKDYPYRCDMTCTGVTSDMYAEVVFSVMQASGGDYAPICETKTDLVSIWSKQNVTITVPTVIITK